MVAGAAINRDNKGDLAILGGFDKSRAHAVAIGKTVGEHNFDVLRFNAGEFQGFFHDCTGGNAVYIIIAVDEDFFFTPNSLFNAVDSCRHIGENKGIGKGFVSGI